MVLGTRMRDMISHQLVLKDKPYAATSKEWRQWNAKAKAEQPVAYWIHEVAIDWIEDQWHRFVTSPINETRWAIRHRFFDRYNIIHTGLKSGYYDADTRLLHGMFNLLVDFVEVEKAWMHVVFDKDAQKTRKHPWWSLGWTRFKAFRDPEAGLAHLAWEMSLDDPALNEYERSDAQAESAREQLALYNWWKHVRPARPDAYDASGWSDYCEQRRAQSEDPLGFLDHEDETDEQRANTKRILDLNHQIEKQYEDEDQEMLIRLIKIRKGLWT